MQKQAMIDTIKSSYMSWVQNLEQVPTQSSLDQLKWHQDALILLGNIDLIESQEETHDEQTTAIATYDHSEAENETEVETANSEQDNQAYPLIRHLRGGFIEELNTPVPEGAIRSIQAQHGDLLSGEYNGNGRYYFTLEETREEQHHLSERVEVNYGIIEREGSTLMVKEHLQDGQPINVRVNGLPHTFIISENDRYDFRLQDGDIVDLAYIQNNPSKVVVVWKHDIKTPKQSKPKKAGYYKDKQPSQEPNYQPLLADQTVFVLGCEPRKAEFESKINAYQGDMIWAEGTEGETRLENMVKKADVVVILISFIKHHASQFTVEMCKRHQTPYSIVDTLGVQTVVDSAIQPQVKRSS